MPPCLSSLKPGHGKQGGSTYMDRNNRVLQLVTQAGYPDKEVAVSLPDFFEGNSDMGSIGVNIFPKQPTPQEFYSIFLALKASGKAEEILVRIADTEDDWFFTDTVYVIGSISMEELRDAVKTLEPDEIYTDWLYDKPSNIPDFGSEKKVYSLWWD